MVDRYSNWILVKQSKEEAKGLVSCLRETFATFGITEELASDGGSEFTSNLTKDFLHNWGVHHRLSSVAFPHSNCRAEIGVKSAKRMISSNTGPHGELNVDAFQRAILQHRNTPDPGTKLSPAQCIFGRPIRDFIPILPARYKPHSTWEDTLAMREQALRNRHMKAAEKWTEHTKRLPPLKVGDKVRIQNQTGQHPNKWDKTGTVVEVKQFDQYCIKVDGSGRVSLRNRKFLRKFIPVKSEARFSHRIQDDIRYLPRPMFNLPENKGSGLNENTLPYITETTSQTPSNSAPASSQPPPLLPLAPRSFTEPHRAEPPHLMPIARNEEQATLPPLDVHVQHREPNRQSKGKLALRRLQGFNKPGHQE